MGALTAVIDLPTNFVFDPDETEYVQKNSFRTGIDVNTFKVLDGNKLEITVGGKNNFNAFSNGKVYFVGHYTAGTTGNQTFNLESVKTAYMPDSSGNAPVLADNGGENSLHLIRLVKLHRPNLIIIQATLVLLTRKISKFVINRYDYDKGRNRFKYRGVG